MYTRNEQIQIANTIIQQLGGNRFRVMTGARNFRTMESGLSFNIPGGGGFAKDGINIIQITLDPDDTYTIRAFKGRRARGTPKGTTPVVQAKGDHSGVYNDMLPAVFTDMTGLETHL